MADYESFNNSMEQIIDKIFSGDTNYTQIFNQMLEVLSESDKVLQEDPQLGAMSQEIQRATKKLLSGEEFGTKDFIVAKELARDPEIIEALPTPLKYCAERFFGGS